MSTIESDAPTQPENPPVEVVDRAEEPGTDLARRNDAIDQVADAALTMPGVPGRDEFLALAMQARVLSMSGAAPEAVRNNPYIAFHVAMVGRDLGISPSAALNLIDVIPGKRNKPAQLSLSPQLLNGQIRRLGLGSIRPGVRTDERAVAVVRGPHGEILGESEFTWEDARIAGLVGPECKPGAHKTESKTRTRDDGTTYSQTSCGCNTGYISYPKRMLWWRAAGFAADDFFPEASLGLYSPEALGAVVDEDGRPIDPATVDLPDGYGPTDKPVPPGDVWLRDAHPDELADLQRRIGAITEAHADARTAALALWGKTDDPLPVPNDLQVKHLVKAKARLSAVEDRIGRRDFGDDALDRWTHSTQPPAEDAPTAATAPADDGPADTASEAPQSATGDLAGLSTAEAAVPAPIWDAVADMPVSQVVEQLFNEEWGWSDEMGDPPTNVADQRRALAVLIHARNVREIEATFAQQMEDARTARRAPTGEA